ncbi:hypothetical protein F0562_022243 [Nyssa sinensis]|uniref:Uncharacterized protein n=1 Tax=Nyssa sinensis TaxID=561372 RepID=A0A5J5BSN7_9ASTE|nr:hypothetical protein F0562_022243 [Nyssa sinensis]
MNIFSRRPVMKPIESPADPWEKKLATAVQATSAKPIQKPVEEPKVSVRVSERPTIKEPKGSLDAEEEAEPKEGLELCAEYARNWRQRRITRKKTAEAVDNNQADEPREPLSPQVQEQYL